MYSCLQATGTVLGAASLAESTLPVLNTPSTPPLLGVCERQAPRLLPPLTLVETGTSAEVWCPCPGPAGIAPAASAMAAASASDRPAIWRAAGGTHMAGEAAMYASLLDGVQWRWHQLQAGLHFSEQWAAHTWQVGQQCTPPC